MVTIISLSLTFLLGFGTGASAYHVLRKLRISCQAPPEQVTAPNGPAPAYEDIFGAPHVQS
jgi:hypothetical protein